MGVNHGVRNLVDKAHALDQVGHNGLAHPAQGKADDCDAKLDAVHHLIEVAMKSLNDQLLDAGIPNTDERKLGLCEESVSRYQEQDKENPEQHVGEHRLANSNIPKR